MNTPYSNFQMDPGDQYDTFKWDFDEHGLTSVEGSDHYPYRIRPTSNRNTLKLLETIRDKVNRMTQYIYENMSMYPEEAVNGLELFVMMHGEIQTPHHYVPTEAFVRHWVQNNGYTSRVLYAEIPKGTAFSGINKPRDRYIDKRSPPIGKDRQMRSNWRHMFLTLPKSNKLTSKLKRLVIHELAHTAASHQRWRDDDHGKDFKMYERIIKDAWENTDDLVP